jgi:LuxR family transcriptional regulator, maltose regulon positive regulatory protein
VTDSPDSGGTSSKIVQTKLLAPAPRSEQVLRTELIELLEAGSDRKLTLVGAPVGYGKTTLLTQWRRSQGPNVPFAWVSLDEQDNDPVRLWRHVIEALRQRTPEEALGADVLVGLGVVGANLIETVLPMLINDLTKLPHRVVLVLDDYHLIKQKACHETVAFFVEHLPETIHLVISTRSKPALGLGQLRARGEMNEIRIEQLAFSEREAASLLKEEFGLDISRSDLSVLLERTEGWPAGIYLATLSMRGKDSHAFIESLRGSSRYIVDLLAEVVLPTFWEEQRYFLLRTSVLEKMSGSLCDEVVGMEGSGKLLRELERSNLFVVPLDEEGEWYRYHQLFSDFLLYELKNIHPKLVPILHGRASAWFEREGQVEDAVRHAIAAGEYERAGILVARHWFGYFVTGQTVTLERWLEALPEGLVHSNAALALVHAWISASQGRREKTERFLAIAEDSAQRGDLPDGGASVESSAAAIRATFGYGGVQERVEAARRAATLELGRTSPQAALARLGVGANLYLSGDTRQARRSLEEGLALTDASQPLLRMSMLAVLSFVATDEESLQEGESLARWRTDSGCQAFPKLPWYLSPSAVCLHAVGA